MYLACAELALRKLSHLVVDASGSDRIAVILMVGGSESFVDVPVEAEDDWDTEDPLGVFILRATQRRTSLLH